MKLVQNSFATVWSCFVSVSFPDWYDDDVLRQTISLYARANKIIRSFSCASLSVKLALFKAYCTPIYGCQLWSRLVKYSNRKLQVAYNDAFRQLLCEPRRCSASMLFVYNNVPSFDAVVRKLVYSFWCSLCKSDNMLIQAVLSSDIYFQSSLFQRWRILF